MNPRGARAELIGLTVSSVAETTTSMLGMVVPSWGFAMGMR